MMYTYNWQQWLAFFFIYCLLGWIFESTYVSLKSKHFVNRGFLRIPMLPLYGTGAVMMLWVSLPVKNNLFLVYLFGVIAATILEYVTGYGMERLFKMKYWDYSNQRFQLQGYICLSSSIAWGVLTIVLTEIIHKPIEQFVLGMNPIGVSGLIAAVGAIITVDAIQSTKAALDLGRVLESMTKMKAELDGLQVQLNLLKGETAQIVSLLREEASLKVTEFKEETYHKISDLKEETYHKISDLKEETSQKMAEFKEETAQRVADLRETAKETMESWDLNSNQKLEISEIMAAATAHKNRAAEELQQKISFLSEKRRALSERLGTHKTRILRDNPSASSGRFSEALREIKEALESRKR